MADCSPRRPRSPGGRCRQPPGSYSPAGRSRPTTLDGSRDLCTRRLPLSGDSVGSWWLEFHRLAGQAATLHRICGQGLQIQRLQASHLGCLDRLLPRGICPCRCCLSFSVQICLLRCRCIQFIGCGRSCSDTGRSNNRGLSPQRGSCTTASSVGTGRSDTPPR